MRAPVTLLAAVLLAGGALASPALAAPPLEPLPTQADDSVDLCGVTVSFQTVVNKAKLNTKTGRISGAIEVLVTNEDNGRSVLVNASGPGFVAETFDETTGLVTVDLDFRGQSLIAPISVQEIPLFEAAGLPQIFTTSGPLSGTIVFDPVTNETVSISFDTPRRIVDVCAQIT